MIRCQNAMVYPETFSNILSPVLMLHGDYDPHPGKMIRDNLKPFLPLLDYREFEKCGHQPAIERHSSDTIFTMMRYWLMKHVG